MMAKVTIGFEDSEDGTVEVTFQCDEPLDLENIPEELTEAQDMALTALDQLNKYLEENEGDLVDITDMDMAKLN